MNTKIRELNQALNSASEGRLGLFQPALSIDLFEGFGTPDGETFLDSWGQKEFSREALCRTLEELEELDVLKEFVILTKDCN